MTSTITRAKQLEQEYIKDLTGAIYGATDAKVRIQLRNALVCLRNAAKEQAIIEHRQAAKDKKVEDAAKAAGISTKVRSVKTHGN